VKEKVVTDSAMSFSGWARRAATALLLVAMCFGSLAHASSADDDKEKAVETVRRMFVALANDDLGLFKSVTATDFYAFDVGKRFNGDQLMRLVIEAHASGRRYVWEVTDPEVRVEGNTAWVTYVNRGSVQDAAGVTERSWLESAVLGKEEGVWRIHFFHSTRVQPD
jgi:ketosteroid isomerase-like protein